VERTQAWLAASSRHHVVTLGDPAYPPLLLATADPPVLL
jgi:DNA processing protein